MANPKVIAEGFTCDELAEALMVRLKPFILESIQEGLAKLNSNFQPDITPEKINGLISDEPIVSDQGRYSVTEASEILKIHRSTLFLHTKQGKIRCGIRKSNGRKFYLGSDIKKLWRSQY